MNTVRRRRVLSSLATALGVALVTLLVGLAGVLVGVRGTVSEAHDELSRVAGAVTDLPEEGVTPEQIQGFVSAIPEPTILRSRSGVEIARTGPAQGLWDRGAAGWLTGLATLGQDRSVVEGAVTVTRIFPSGRSIELRRDVGTAATTVSGRQILTVGAVALALGLLVGILAYLLRRRRDLRVSEFTTAAEAVASGRVLPAEALPARGEFVRAGSALRTSAERLSQLGEVAERELGVLKAAIEPLPVGVAGRTPSGGRIRNLALERALDEMGPGDRAEIEGAIADGLDATGPVSRRVALTSGRSLDIDAWGVPGGRLASVAERTEQDRIAALRRQLEGTAVRQLRAPVDEIKARGTELYKHVPASAGASLKALLAATDRLDRVVRMMLRGTSQDPTLRPPRRETFGVAGFLWGLTHDWDSALRTRAIRVELDIAPDLPDVRTDPALVEEILTELIDNAAKFTPRGGTVRLAATAAGETIALEVSDTGPGIRAEDAPHATERFFRGDNSESIPGAGLGLGVARALADRIEATLVVEPGEGGRVRLELPTRRRTGSAELVGATG
jgi:signal transduction histidine kinase